MTDVVAEGAFPGSELDAPSIERAPWLTPRRLMLFVIGWILLFALVSVFVSNPFQSEPKAGVGPNYWHVMFLHGLLISMVGLGALVACQVLGVRSRHVRVWIAVGVLAATIFAATGGIWDKKVPGDEVPMWTQIAGFFALDEILLVLLIGIVGEWRRRSSAARTLPPLVAGVATASMLAAALIGHLAGWILEFGNSPGVIGRWERFVGEGRAEFTNNLIVSHSHAMVVATMALIVALAAQQFRYASLEGASRTLARVGLGAIAAGTIGMSGIYIAAAFSTWEPPTWLTSHQGTNGIASDDIVTGVLVMGGGLLVLAAYALVGAGKLASLRRRPVRIATLWAWALSFATVVVAGYAIELDETYFGKGDPKAAGAAKDAVYTWIHQDIGLFLLPMLTLVMLAVERLIARRRQGVIGLATIAGTSIAFVGTLIFVFVDPARRGAGYVVSTIGLAVIGAALLATIWYATLGDRRELAPVDAAAPQPAGPSS
ncbi:MAG: hypothetical protein ACHP93_05030 [Solirubrobacterales bacterium]